MSLGIIPAMASDEAVVAVETPIEMALVSETDGNYEYSVSVNATVTKNSEAVEGSAVSILMFANKDNSAFVEAEKLSGLTVGEIAADYYVYYADQGTTDAEGAVSFEFAVDFPAPAKADAYYVWIGTDSTSSPAEVGLEDMAVSSQVVAVTLTASSTSVKAGSNVTLTPDALNVFGNSVANAPDFSYTVTTNGDTIDAAIADNVLSTYSLLGTYGITVSATGADGNVLTSEELLISIAKAIVGDADGNDRVNLQDALAVLKYVAEIATDSNPAAADVDGNGTVNINDACLILRYIARIINQL